MGERLQIDLTSMLQNFIFTTCQRHTTGTGANSAGNACFSLLLSTRGILHSSSGVKFGLDYLNCTEWPDHAIEDNTTGPNCVFCPALNVFKFTACQWCRDGRWTNWSAGSAGGNLVMIKGKRCGSQQHGSLWTGIAKPKDQTAATSESCFARGGLHEGQHGWSKCILLWSTWTGNTQEWWLKQRGGKLTMRSKALFFFPTMWVWQAFSDHPLKYHSKCWILSAHLRQKYSFHCLI